MSVNLVTFLLAWERYNDSGVDVANQAMSMRGPRRNCSGAALEAGKIRWLPSPGSSFICIPSEPGAGMAKQAEIPKKKTMADEVADLRAKRAELELGGGKERH